MTKGLRCPNCDITINKKVVHDWLVNQKGPYLRCKNSFCNTRWSRSVLEAHRAELFGEASPAPKAVVKAVSTPPPLPVEAVAAVRPSPPKPAPKSPAGSRWLDRIRSIAKHHAQTKGVVAIDDLRLWADIHNDHPPSNSMWGSVFHGVHWKRVKQKSSTYTASRSRKVNVWALRAPVLVS